MCFLIRRTENTTRLLNLGFLIRGLVQHPCIRSMGVSWVSGRALAGPGLHAQMTGQGPLRATSPGLFLGRTHVFSQAPSSFPLLCLG